MKICLVINDLSAGGAERALSLLANYWAEQNHSIEIVTFDGGSVDPFYHLDPAIDLHPLGVNTSTLPLAAKFKAIPRIQAALAQSFREISPDVVISFMDQANLLSLLAAPKSIPVLVCEQVHPGRSSLVERGQPLLLRMAFKLLREWLYRRASAVVLLSHDSKSYFSKAVQKRIEIIPNPAVEPLIEELDVEIPRQSILTIGRLSKQKNFPLLLRAFADVVQEEPDWNLVIIGEGPERETLEQLISALNLRGQARLAGRTKAPYAALKQADFYVLSSDYEGFPLTLCEAMASGKAVIATDCPTGPRDLLEGGKSGVLVPVGDRKALGEAILRLIREPELRREYEEQGRTVLERYGLAKIASKWEELMPPS